jgi:ribosome-binding factor A
MHRMLRVNELLKRELGLIFERKICAEVECLVTITAIKTSPDLHNAVVYVSVYGDDKQKQAVLKSLSKQRIEIQREVSKHVRLKYTPILKFKLDEHLAEADRIDKILDSLGLDGEYEEPT